MSFSNKNVKGFTLVELAIVLVIIGLLVGGVLQGQELIRQAQIRSVVAKVQELDTALNTFRAKYREYPGDISRARQYGVNCPKAGAACAAGTDNVALTASDGSTNGALGNGDGDFNLEDEQNTASDGTEFTSFSGEIANFWVHLSNTFLVKGSFAQSTTACADDACVAIAGTNFPDASLGNGIIVLSEAGRLNWVAGVGSDAEDLDGAEAAANSPYAQTLTPEEAFGIDSKLDDGQPDNGIVQAIASYDGTFTDDAAAANECFTAAGVYALSLDLRNCSLRIRASG